MKSLPAYKMPWIIAAASAFFLCINLLIFYPGLSTYDSDKQYAQAVAGIYYDWHPPIMAALFRILRVFGEGTGPLYTVHVFLYWLAFGIIANALAKANYKIAAWITIGIALLPAFVLENPIIQKDVGLAVSALAGFALIFWSRSQQKRISPLATICILVLLGYATLVRANGIFATAPIFIYFLVPQITCRPIRYLFCLLALIGFSIPASNAFNHRILRSEWAHPIRSLQLFDIAGIAYHSNDVSVFWEKSVTLEDVRQCYTPIFWDSLGKCRAIKFPDREIASYWKTAIVSHPLAYLKHRLNNYNLSVNFLSSRRNAEERNQLQDPIRDPGLQKRTVSGRFFDYLIYNPLFSPAFAIILGLVVLSLSVGSSGTLPDRYRYSVICLMISGLLYSTAFFVISVASEERYYFWPKMAIYLGAGLFVGIHGLVKIKARSAWISFAILVATIALISAGWAGLSNYFY